MQGVSAHSESVVQQHRPARCLGLGQGALQEQVGFNNPIEHRVTYFLSSRSLQRLKLECCDIGTQGEWRVVWGKYDVSASFRKCVCCLWFLGI